MDRIEITASFEKTARSGYFYHATSAESEELIFRKNPVAAKSGYRVKLWMAKKEYAVDEPVDDDIPVLINGVEEVAEYEKNDLFQIHTDKETWEQIVGVAAAPSRSEQHAIDRQRRKDMWAREEAEWDARRSQDCCIETLWQRNTARRYAGGTEYIAADPLPAWMGADTKIYLSEKMGSGQGPSLQIAGLPDPKQWYTLRINNVWVSFLPGFQPGRVPNPHHAFVSPDEWELIFNYEGGPLPDELAPPRTRNEIRFEGKDLGFRSEEYYEWVEEAKEIQSKVWGVALAYGQLTLYQRNQEGAEDRVRGYEDALNRYAEKIGVLDEELDASAIHKIRRRQSEIEHKLAELRQYVDHNNEKIDRYLEHYNEASARYKDLVARREYWEEGVHPDDVPISDELDTPSEEINTPPTEPASAN